MSIMNPVPSTFASAVTQTIWVAAITVCGLAAGCQTSGPAPLPERPPAIASAISYEQAIDHAVNDLLIQAQRLPEFQPAAPASPLTAVFQKEQAPPAKPRIALDSALDGITGQQTVATRILDQRLLDGVRTRFPGFQVSPISTGELATARFILTTVLTALDRGQDKTVTHRISLSLTDNRNGIVVAQSAARATGETVDITPTSFFRDSPSLVKDRTVEGQIRTSQTAAGKPADDVYLANLSVVALIAEGSRLYEAGQYAESLALYETAAARPDGKHLRIYNGAYLSNIQLGRMDAAEQVFGRLVLLGLTTNSLSIKFLFKPASTDFWPDPKINAVYPMWVRVLARESAAAKACITIAGHSSRTGTELANDRLSLQRAMAVQKRLEVAAPDMVGRLQSIGVGFRENLIGTGSDDARDTLDRRVDFRVHGC